MLRDVKLKMWQSVLLAFVISGVLLVVVFMLLPGGENQLLVPVAS
ncbi:MAG TPA: hypothetical protein VMY88_11230 [Acidimicrobiales bacterium]|nr:hypothetical protein [Acidimicrobiales bacterium]